MLKVEKIMDAAHEGLVTISSDAKLIEVTKLLTSGTDIVVVCDSTGALEGVITKTDVVKKSVSVRVQPACARHQAP